MNRKNDSRKLKSPRNAFEAYFFKIGARFYRIKGVAAALLISLFFIMPGLIAQPVSATSISPNLVIATDTQTLLANSENQVKLHISNTGDAFASQVYVSVGLPSSATGGSAMILVGSDGRYFIGDLVPGGSADINLRIIVSASAANNQYQLSFALSYNYNTTTKTETRNIGFIVPAIDKQGAIISATLSQGEINAGMSNSINLTLTNIGDDEAKVVSVSLTLPGAGTTSSALSLVGSDGKWAFNQLARNQSITIPLTIFASPQSAGSVYQISISLSYSDSLKTKQDTRYLALGIPFTNAPSANLEVSINPQDLKAGFTNDVNITLRNTGNSIAESLTVTLALPGSQATSSPYVMLDSDGSWFISNIMPGNEVTIPLRLFILPSASGTGSTLTLTTTYTDTQYKSKQQINSLGVVVRGDVDLVILDSSTFPQNVVPGMPFSFAITIINLGTTTAQSVIVTPSGTDKITPFSDNKIFLGDLAVNVPSSLTISYMAGNVSNGVYNISLDYSYKNNLGQKLNDQLNASLKLTVNANSTGSSTDTQQPSPSLVGIVLYALPILAVLIIVVYLVRRYRSRSRQ